MPPSCTLVSPLAASCDSLRYGHNWLWPNRLEQERPASLGTPAVAESRDSRTVVKFCDAACHSRITGTADQRA